MKYEAVIGLEVHAELATHSKMFCSCAVVDPTSSRPNIAVCPVCSGLPGVLPVINKQAVELGLRVALALGCEINLTSIFARKNYFYPDLPKGYQISQYEYPLGVNGTLAIETPAGRRDIRVRRVHLEEDTGKLTHIHNEEDYSLVDLNRAGVPLLEIVSEPDLHTAQEVRAYAQGLRDVLRYVEASSGDMERGAMRIEPNISVRLKGDPNLSTRVEIKNLASFRVLEHAVDYQIQKQIEIVESGGKVVQETLGWDEEHDVTVSQRSKEEAHDYRYFPEPDLPPLVVEESWVEAVRLALPELPQAKLERLMRQYELSLADARMLVEDRAVAAYFERCAAELRAAPAKMAANWMMGEMGAWMSQNGAMMQTIRLSPADLAGLLDAAVKGTINLSTAKAVLVEMLQTGKGAAAIIQEKGLHQVSDADFIAGLIRQTLDAYPDELTKYINGKETVGNWLFGQVMRAAKGKANPQVVQAELDSRLKELKK